MSPDICSRYGNYHKNSCKTPEVLNNSNSELEQAGMRVNWKKPDVMMMSGQKDEIESRLGGTVLELVNHIKYLGVVINENKCKMELYIKS